MSYHLPEVKASKQPEADKPQDQKIEGNSKSKEEEALDSQDQNDEDPASPSKHESNKPSDKANGSNQ